MPAWMTSLLRELVPVPKLGAASTTSASRPAIASARDTARPTTPAPTTTASAASRGTPVARPRRRRRPLDTHREHARLLSVHRRDFCKSSLAQHARSSGLTATANQLPRGNGHAQRGLQLQATASIDRF
jgi:hypothetical protein